MTRFLTCLSAFIIVACFSFRKSRDKAVAQLVGGRIVLIDSIAVKQRAIADLSASVKNLVIDKTVVKEVATLGEKAQKEYILLFTDTKSQRRIGQYLFKIGDKFYLYYDLDAKQKKTHEAEPFYYTYYACHGSSDPHCTPHIAIIDGEYMWGSGSKLVCNPADPCRGSQILVVH